MKGIVVNLERCRGCGLCVGMCPQKIIEVAPGLNSDGYHPSRLRDADECTGCAVCAWMCPHVAITRVYR